MRSLLTLVVLTLTVAASRGQNAWYTLQPNDTIVGVAAFNNLTAFDFYQVNAQSDTLTLQWKFISKEIPTGWQYSICDNNACYPGIPNNGTMNPVAPGEQGFLGFSVMPDTIAGTAVVRMYVFDAAHPDEGDTLTWIITAPAWNGIRPNTVADLRVFPTITNGLVHVESKREIANVRLYDVAGEWLATETINGGTGRVDLTRLNAGMYWLVITQTSGAVRSNRIVVAK
jgi:hypothetical protein